MSNFNNTYKSLKTNFTAARLDLAAMAITHYEVLEKTFNQAVKFYIDSLGYTRREAIKATVENKKAYFFMVGCGFSVIELKSMASNI